MKAAVKALKQKTLECKIKQLELPVYHRHNNTNNLFRTVRELEGKPRKPMGAVKDMQGNTNTDKIEVLKCWEEHFSAHLNTAFPHRPNATVSQ